MKKSFLKKLIMHDEEYEAFRKNTHEKFKRSREEFTQEMRNKSEKSVKDDEDSSTPYTSPQKLWSEAIKKGKF